MEFIEQLDTQYGIRLNAQQAQAVETIGGAILLLAVPGSGKTTVLIARMANMLLHYGVKPHQILTITFSRRSASDMEERYARWFGAAGAQPKFSTIHSFCYGVVNHISQQYHRPLPRVLEDPSEVVRGIFYAQEQARFIERERLDDLVNRIGCCKNRLADEAEIANMKVDGCDFLRLYQAYEVYKRENRLMDYDDMLVFTYDMFRKNPAFLAQYHALYHYINVDEAQDTSLVQHKIIELLAQKRGNLFMVGDEDQSIYGFRGAYPEALLNFAKTYPGAVVLKMEQNYRSMQPVVDAANRLISHNKSRISKQMRTERGTGAAVCVEEVKTPSAQYEAAVRFIRAQPDGTDIAVLYRCNESAIPLVDALSAEGIAFSLKDTREAFFATAHVRDMVAFLRLSINPADLDSFTQIYSKTNAYFSRAVLDYVQANHGSGQDVFALLRRCPATDVVKLSALAAQIRKLNSLPPVAALNLIENIVSRNYFDSDSATQRLMLLKSIAARQKTVEELLERLGVLQNIIKKTPASGVGNVTLSTIHSSKGLEYDKVLLIDLIEGQFPGQQSLDALAEGNRDAFEEEVRLCYVGATRARDELRLVAFEAGNRTCRPSRFVRLLTQDASAPAPKKTAGAGKTAKQIEGYVCVTEEEQLTVGVQVLHERFGEGRILRLDGGFLSWFDGVTTKRLSISVCIENRSLFLRDIAK